MWLDEVTLREFFEARFRDHFHTHTVEERERSTMRDSMEKRLEGMNEFRQSMSDMQGRFVTREIFDGAMLRLANVERLVPLVAVMSAVIGAVISAGIIELVKAAGG